MGAPQGRESGGGGEVRMDSGWETGLLRFVDLPLSVPYVIFVSPQERMLLGSC